MQNPYAPPEHDDHTATAHAAPAADGSVTATATLTEADMAAGLAEGNKRSRWVAPVVFGFLGFSFAQLGGTTAVLVAVPIFAVVGYFLWTSVFRGAARRSLASKTDRERTVTWRFTPETIEITNSTTYTRLMWSTVHRCLEGKQVFALFTSEAVVQIIPKRAFRPEDIETVRGMFAKLITPRKRPANFTRMLVLWAVLVLFFLAIWQFLQVGRTR